MFDCVVLYVDDVECFVWFCGEVDWMKCWIFGCEDFEVFVDLFGLEVGVFGYDVVVVYEVVYCGVGEELFV